MQVMLPDTLRAISLEWRSVIWADRWKLTPWIITCILRSMWKVFLSLIWVALGRMMLAFEIRSLKDGDHNLPFGRDLADAAARSLEARVQVPPTSGYGSALAYSHKYYCGHGLFLGWSPDRAFQFAECEDGLPSTTLLLFETRTDFVNWLAAQTDLSLSGLVSPLRNWHQAGNQRLTREVLEVLISKAANQLG